MKIQRYNGHKEYTTYLVDLEFHSIGLEDEICFLPVHGQRDSYEKLLDHVKDKGGNIRVEFIYEEPLNDEIEINGIKYRKVT